MFNKKRLDNLFYPGIIVIAAAALAFVGFEASGVLTMENVEAERVAARERALEAQQETDADTEATDDGDW